MRWQNMALQVRVGLFTLLLLSLGAGLILVSGGRSRLLGDTYPLRVSFSTVDGLIVGSPVRLAGLTVGRVTGFVVDAAARQQVTVELAISRRFQEQIRGDSTASLGTAGVVGDRFVQITLGSPTARVLPSGAVIPSRDTADLTRVLVKSDQLITNLIQVTASIQTMLATLHERGVEGDVAATVRSLRNVTHELEEGQGLLHAMIYDRDAAKALADLREAARAARAVAGVAEQHAPEATKKLADAAAHLEAILREVHEGDGTLHGLIYGNSDETLGRLGRTLASLERTAQQLEDVAGHLKEGDGLLPSLIYDPEGKKMFADIREATRSLTALLQEAHTGDGLLRALLAEPGGREMIENLRKVSENLRTITDKIAQGKGTVGALIDDPTVYEDLSSLLRGANRSWLLRTLIRSSVKRGQENGDGAQAQMP